MREIDKAYLAGLFDGDGCVTISKHQRKESESPVYTLTCVIVNSNEDMILRCKRLTKLGNVYDGHTTNKTHGYTKPLYEWRVTGKSAEKFLTLIWPHIYGKKNQVTVALAFRSTYPAYKGAKKMDQEIVELREEYRTMLSEQKK